MLYIYLCSCFLDISSLNYLYLCFSFFISRIWNETWLSSFFYKPCNYELFVKQSLNMEMAIVRARVWKMLSHITFPSCYSYLLIGACVDFFPICFLLEFLLHTKTLGCWNGLDNSSWYWWVTTPSWCQGVFFEAVAAWCAWECGYGYFSELCKWIMYR